MDELEVNIEIGNNFLTPKVIGNQGLTTLEAIAELLANSFDWRITGEDPEQTTKITIRLGENSIEVIDNGVGMTRDKLNKGINLAESSDEISKKHSEFERMGRFGMGMKIASLSLGWKFTITTISHENPDKENIFEFNAQNLEDPNSTYLNELKIITRDKLEDSPLKGFNSGTSIKIEDLVLGLPSGTALAVGMHKRFSPMIKYLRDKNRLDFNVINEDGLEIPVGESSIEPVFEDKILRLDFENPSKWAKRKEYKYTGDDGKEYQLHGYIDLLKQRSVHEGNYGFDLWCRGQLIEGFHKTDKKDSKAVGLFSIAGRAGEKTYGVLHLDGCTPDTVKAKGFTPGKSFLDVRKLIEEDLKLYKKLGAPSRVANQLIRDEINKRRGLGSDIPSTSENADDTNPDPDDASESMGDTSNVSDPLEDKPEGTIMITDKQFVQIKKSWVFDNALDEKQKTSWEYFHRKSTANDDITELQIYINPQSNIYKSIQEIYPNQSDQNKVISFFKKMAISESFFSLCVSEWGYSTEAARRITDEKIYPQVLKLKLD